MNKKLGAAATRSLALIVGVFVAFCLFEGIASVGMVASSIRYRKGTQLAERLYTRYDAELGWVNIPNAYIRDMYGPGKYVKIDSQGYRDNVDFSTSVPANKVRVLCSGDSFTFGYGVDNDHAWCQLLPSIDPRIESVNMGQGGYGLDQAYLWYMRDGTKLDVNVHLFAFTFTDFPRMLSDEFLGYGKPMLVIRDGHLVTRNVPVPRGSYRFQWLTEVRPQLEQLRLIQLYEHLVPRPPPQSQQDFEHADQVVESVFSTLAAVDSAKGARLVAIYLPTTFDYTTHANDILRQQLAQLFASQKRPFIDLTDALGALSPADRDKMFIAGQSAGDFANAAGHYTEAGNAWVAKALDDRLQSMGLGSARAPR